MNDLVPSIREEVSRLAKSTSPKSNVSAGILAYRRGPQGLEILLVHPGGPFWHNKDEGAWSIPKSELDPSEDPEEAARREFTEELRSSASVEALQALGQVRQRGGKRVIAFCAETAFDPTTMSSNTFEVERPPKSGRRRSFPEVDRAAWFDLRTAR